MRAFASVIALALTACGTASPPQPPVDGRATYHVEVGATGYTPAEITAPAGAPVRIVFTRTSDEGCGQEVVFPDLGIRRDLPRNVPVWIETTTPASGRLSFTCGMAMYQGAIVVE